MLRMARNTLLLLIVFGALLYFADYGVLRLRAATNRNAYGTVSVDKYYAIRQKNGKTELDFAGTENQTCVRSLLPHMGYQPCWYLTKHTEQQINI